MEGAVDMTQTKSMSLLPKLNWNMQDPKIYKAKINSLCCEDTTDFTTSQLVDMIKHSAMQPAPNRLSFKQKWFDAACLKARRASFRWLTIVRKQNTDLARERYQKANSYYKNLCKTKKVAYRNTLIKKLDQVRDAKSWWNLVTEIRGGTNKISTAIDVDCLRDYFKALLNPPICYNLMAYASPLITDDNLDRPFEMQELHIVLSKVKDNKAPGMDRVPYEFYKHAPESFLMKLLQGFNGIYDTADVPDSFTKSVIFPIHKKGDPNCVQNYRGITFMDAIAKIFVGLLYNRVVQWERRHSILSECQAGFRPGYSTIDNIFNLLNIIKLCHSMNKKKVYAFFVDLKAAFDTIDRDLLFYKLHNLGMPTKFVRTLQGLYRNTQATVWNGEGLSQSFTTNSGVKQGCVLSPLLFSFFINDLEENLEVGVTIDDIEIKLLMYADDIVILSDDALRLQRMMYKLEQYCSLWNLRVNLDKSKVMIFQRGGGRRKQEEKWTYDSKTVEVVKEYIYLGIILTPKVSLAANFKKRLESAKTSLNVTWKEFVRKEGIKPADKLKMFNAAMRSILCYGAQVWGFEQHDIIEKLQRFFIKKLFHLPVQTPNYMITLETGLPSVYEYTLRCHYRYLARVLYKYSRARLPHRLAAKVIEKNIYWHMAWEELHEKHNLVVGGFENLNFQLIRRLQEDIIRKEKAWIIDKAVTRARGTVRHEMYDKLHYFSGKSYIQDTYSTAKIGVIFKYRGGLVNLNASPWRMEGSSMCSLCNMEEEENLLHFVGRCPILSELRVLAFGKKILTELEVIDTLNGKNDYNDLFLYATKAEKYRNFLVSEFNN